MQRRNSIVSVADKGSPGQDSLLTLRQDPGGCSVEFLAVPYARVRTFVLSTVVVAVVEYFSSELVVLY